MPLDKPTKRFLEEMPFMGKVIENEFRVLFVVKGEFYVNIEMAVPGFHDFAKKLNEDK